MTSPLRRRLAAGIAAALSSLMALTLGCPPLPVRAAGARCRPVQANSQSSPVGISGDGRFVLFASDATNLIPGGGGSRHLYVRDLRRCVTQLVDVTATGGVPAGTIFHSQHLSADGRYALFASDATDLVDGDTNGTGDVFLRDLTRRTTELISRAHDGGAADSVSWPAGVSADGRYVLFVSMVTNLLAGPPPNSRNVYLRDRRLRSTRLIATVPPNSIAPAWAPHLSPDGRFSLIDLLPTTPVGEQRWLTHLVDNQSLHSRLVSVSIDGDRPDDSTAGAGTSAGGRFVLLNSSATDLVPGDTNGATDAFVRDMVAGQTRRISLTSAGGQANNGSSGWDISPDGRYVALSSAATDMVPGDTNSLSDVFVRDTVAGTTVRASVAGDGAQANGESSHPSISADGRYVLFWSFADNLVSGDTNGVADVFVRDLRTGATTRVSVG